MGRAATPLAAADYQDVKWVGWPRRWPPQTTRMGNGSGGHAVGHRRLPGCGMGRAATPLAAAALNEPVYE